MDEQKNRTEFKYTDDGNMSYLFNNDSKPNEWLRKKLAERSVQLDSGNLSLSNIDDNVFYEGKLGEHKTSFSSSSGSSSSGHQGTFVDFSTIQSIIWRCSNRSAIQ